VDEDVREPAGAPDAALCWAVGSASRSPAVAHRGLGLPAAGTRVAGRGGSPAVAGGTASRPCVSWGATSGRDPGRRRGACVYFIKNDQGGAAVHDAARPSRRPPAGRAPGDQTRFPADLLGSRRPTGA